MKYIVLGGTGEMGRVTVRDLVETTKEDTQIIIASRNGKETKQYAASFRQKRVKGTSLDVTDIAATAKLLQGADVAVNCTQYYFNISVMNACLKAKCHYLDLGGLFHVVKQQQKLHAKFRHAGLTALLGCGSTPGITNVLASYASRFFDRITEVHVRFAGKDYTKYSRPFILPYSIYTLAEEFSVPSAIFAKGKTIFVKAVSQEEQEFFPPPVGKVTCFATLHSEVATFPSSFKLKECTFKLAFPPSFVHDMKTLLQLGLLSPKPITVRGTKIRPIDVAAAQMRNSAMDPKAKVHDLEFLRVRMLGKKNGKNKKMTVDCLAKSSRRWNAAAGSIDTGVPPSILAQMIAKGEISLRGAIPPESAVPAELFFHELQRRGMNFFVDGKKKRFKEESLA